MTYFRVDTNKLEGSSQSITGLSAELQKINGELGNISLATAMQSPSARHVDKLIRQATEAVLDEAVKMKSLSEALQAIANQYVQIERSLCDLDGTIEASVASGTDKRNWWTRFWDWVFKREPDDYATTTDEQEKAADAAMRSKLQKVLQDEKYSPENWDRASIEERKQILQDYMDAVIGIYGLRSVNKKIKWVDITSPPGGVALGNYNHLFHRVRLNVNVLTDSTGIDSYALLGTVAHELRHAYQHEAIDHPTRFMVSQETIDTWKYNFDHYVKYEDDRNGYFSQSVEVDARSFEVSR